MGNSNKETKNGREHPNSGRGMYILLFQIIYFKMKTNSIATLNTDQGWVLLNLK